jgi:hypothetical protein
MTTSLKSPLLPCAVGLCAAMLVAFAPQDAGPDARHDDELARSIPAIQAFLGSEAGATAHEQAPPQLQQFGRLAGLWRTEQEMRMPNGPWTRVASGYWAWKVTLGGFAIADLWYQGSDQLPPYMQSFGREYLLSSIRTFDVRAGDWKVAWMSNGAGKSPGDDFGTFTASADGDRLVMLSPSDPVYGTQRVVFSDFEADAFTWLSEYTTDDGATWTQVMRVKAERVR